MQGGLPSAWWFVSPFTAWETSAGKNPIWSFNFHPNHLTFYSHTQFTKYNLQSTRSPDYLRRATLLFFFLSLSLSIWWFGWTNTKTLKTRFDWERVCLSKIYRDKIRQQYIKSQMDLDKWIAKVKEGQHLAEDELQLLCEYVIIFLLSLFLLPFFCISFVNMYLFANR